jgi:hypothetical protein
MQTSAKNEETLLKTQETVCVFKYRLRNKPTCRVNFSTGHGFIFEVFVARLADPTGKVEGDKFNSLAK